MFLKKRRLSAWLVPKGDGQLTIFLTFILLSNIMSTVSAQNVYTNLHDAQQVQNFSEVSEQLVCQCGCNFVLSVCPHVECPWGIPARRFIEGRIKDGATAAEIVHKFRYGFGPGIKQHADVQKLMAEGQSNLVMQLVQGYGPKIIARSSLGLPLLLIALLVVSSGIAFRYWWQRKK